jgi:hypothetical protein
MYRVARREQRAKSMHIQRGGTRGICRRNTRACATGKSSEAGAPGFVISPIAAVRYVPNGIRRQGELGASRVEDLLCIGHYGRGDVSRESSEVLSVQEGGGPSCSSVVHGCEVVRGGVSRTRYLLYDEPSAACSTKSIEQE